MPSIDVAMARSLRPPAWELVRDALARSVAETLTRRNIVTDTQGKITDVKTAFSSWDNCMQATFCKWPVIAVIIVGGLIILSIVWCIVRCCCCGLSCCCSCFSCLKCCGDCCGCCDPPGGRKHKYLDEPYIPPHHGQGYRSEAPMQAHLPSSTPSKFEPPQYAEFEVSKKGGDDALPQMPSWDHAGSKKVVLAEEEVEMSNLKKSPTLPLNNNNRMNSPSPGPVSPMSMNHNRSYGNLPASASGHMSNHSQQGLMPNPQSPGFSQPGQGPYGARDQGYNNSFDTSRQSVGFGLDEPYDDHAPLAGANAYGQAGHQAQPYGAPGHQPYDNNNNNNNMSYGAAAAAAGAVGAAGIAGAMAPRNQSTSPHHQTYGAPPVIGAARGPGGRQSPAPVQTRSPYGQEQIHEQYAEMPANPLDRSGHSPSYTQQNPALPVDHTAPRELAGSAPPDGYGLRRPGTGDNSASSPVNGGRPPYGMDPRMRNSPGPRNTPGPQSESAYGRSPRGTPGPRQDQGYGRPPQSPRDNVNRTYSPAPPRQFTPGPERRFSPGPERQYSPAPDRQRAAAPHPLSQPVPPTNNFEQSPPRSPITNTGGFDFTSGYSRAKEQDVHVQPPSQSPTTASYPGQKLYQSR